MALETTNSADREDVDYAKTGTDLVPVKVNLPAEYRESIKTLVADAGRDDVRVQIERQIKRNQITTDIDKLVERLQTPRPTLNNVLVLTYFKSEFFSGTSLLKADKTLDEDKYQGKGRARHRARAARLPGR